MRSPISVVGAVLYGRGYTSSLSVNLSLMSQVTTSTSPPPHPRRIRIHPHNSATIRIHPCR